jgi:hypothetical protein
MVIAGTGKEVTGLSEGMLIGQEEGSANIISNRRPPSRRGEEYIYDRKKSHRELVRRPMKCKPA